MDCVVYSDQMAEASENWTRPTLLLIPIMFGMKTVNQECYDIIKFALRLPQTVGIIGGKPKSALYFPGFQGDRLIFLDPHKVQPATDEPSTYKSQAIKLIKLKKLESSMALGFYFRTQVEWDYFVSTVGNFNGLIAIQDTVGSDEQADEQKVLDDSFELL